MAMQKVHIVNPKNLDKTICRKDFKKVTFTVHPELDPQTLVTFLNDGAVCKNCAWVAFRYVLVESKWDGREYKYTYRLKE